MRRLGCCLALLFLLMPAPANPQTAAAVEPLRLGMAGLVHGHASGFLTRYLKRTDIQLVGIAEPDAAVASKYQQRFGLDPSRLFATVEQMLDQARPQAVVVFTDTFDHLRVVEACAARGIPVMMEKPLAVSMEHARAIERAARKANIPVMVNYETTWYPSNRAAWTLIKEQKAIGDIRKIVVHDGHAGPEGHQRPARVLRVADRPGPQRRRRAVRLRLLRREPHHLADGRRAADRGDRRDPALPARCVQAGGR